MTGIENYKRLIDDIPNKIQTLVGIICDVDLHKKDGKHYIEIDVKPYDVPISYQGKISLQKWKYSEQEFGMH